MPGQLVLGPVGVGGILRMLLAGTEQVVVLRQVQKLPFLVGEQVHQIAVHLIYRRRPLLQQGLQVHQIPGGQIVIEGGVPIHYDHIRVLLTGQQHLQPVGIDAHQLNGGAGSFCNFLQNGAVGGRRLRQIRHHDADGNGVLPVHFQQLLKGHIILPGIGCFFHSFLGFASGHTQQHHHAETKTNQPAPHFFHCFFLHSLFRLSLSWSRSSCLS